MLNTLKRALALGCAAALAATGLALSGPVLTASAATVSCTSSTPVSSRPTLRLNDTGSCVRLLQQNLANQGWDVNTDGTFTTRTEQAVRRFQSSWLNLTIDGIAGPNTWNMLINGGGTPYSVGKGPNTTSKVVLSFDDCPKSLSAFKTTVNAAESLGIRLVIFTYGDCVNWKLIDPAYARAHGHYVFNHSNTHADLTTLSYAGVLKELAAPGPQTSYGRPPYGAYNLTVKNAYASKPMRIWTWNIDTEDWTGKSQSTVVNYVINNAKAGNTVLMHMQYAAFNQSALSAIKTGLAKKGLSICRNNGAVGVSPSKVDC